MSTATAVTASLRTREARVSRSLSNRPMIVMARCPFEVWNRLALLCCRLRLRGGNGHSSARRSDQAAVPHDDFLDHTLGPLLWAKLALFNGALDKDVLALVKRDRNF